MGDGVNIAARRLCAGGSTNCSPPTRRAWSRSKASFSVWVARAVRVKTICPTTETIPSKTTGDVRLDDDKNRTYDARRVAPRGLDAKMRPC